MEKKEKRKGTAKDHRKKTAPPSFDREDMEMRQRKLKLARREDFMLSCSEVSRACGVIWLRMGLRLGPTLLNQSTIANQSINQ